MQKKRSRYKASQSVRTRMRTILIAVSAITVLITGISIVVFYSVDTESTMAGTDPMVISDIVVFQDTTPVLKGTSMQLVLGINIQTKGKAQNLNFSNMQIAARGTTEPVIEFIHNARLWSTGNTAYFIPVQQVGETVSTVTEEEFNIGSKVKLLEGNNYFWLTYDINQLPGSRINQVDAECLWVEIGTLTHEPPVSAPPGCRKILNNIPFYSTGNTDISSLDSWNSLRDGSGKRPMNFNQLNATFHIQPGHIMRNDLNACISFLLIERNGFLISNSSIKSDRIEILGGGTLVQSKALGETANIERFIIRNGGSYIHQNKGAIPGKIRQLENFSNIMLNDYGPLSFSEQIDWGNLIIDAKEIQNIDFGNCLRDIRGNLEIRNTGEAKYLCTTISDTINIEGNFVINGGWFIIAPAKQHTVLNVNKEFIIKNGSFSDQIPGKLTKGNLEFNPGKMVYVKSGTFRMTAKHSAINLRDEFITWKQDSPTMLLPDITVMPGCTLKIAGNSFGEIGDDRKMIVSATSFLDCGVSTISGDGTFKMEPHACLSTAHPDGIHSDTYTGSIQTAKRIYSSEGDYIFAGSCSPQATGVFSTYPRENTINQMTIDKTNHTGVVVLQQDLKITGRLLQPKGNINKNSHKLEAGDQSTATVAD